VAILLPIATYVEEHIHTTQTRLRDVLTGATHVTRGSRADCETAKTFTPDIVGGLDMLGVSHEKMSWLKTFKGDNTP